MMFLSPHNSYSVPVGSSVLLSCFLKPIQSTIITYIDNL